mgnify:CR=1 FL=1
MSTDQPPLRLDMRGYKCPHPSLRLQKVMREQPGHVVEIWADDPMARVDIPALCQEHGWHCEPLEILDARVCSFRVIKESS